MDINQLKIDTSKDSEGVWVPIGDGGSIKVARLGNRKYNKLAEKILTPHRTAITKGFLNEAEAEKIQAKLIAQTVLLDWKGISDGEKEMPYTPEKAEEILSNPEYSQFRELVMEEAQRIDNFRKEENEKVAGKSEKPLSGNSGMERPKSTS